MRSESDPPHGLDLDLGQEFRKAEHGELRMVGLDEATHVRAQLGRREDDGSRREIGRARTPWCREGLQLARERREEIAGQVRFERQRWWTAAAARRPERSMERFLDERIEEE